MSNWDAEDFLNGPKFGITLHGYNLLKPRCHGSVPKSSQE